VPLEKSRLELARTKEFSGGQSALRLRIHRAAKDGHLDLELYRKNKSACRVTRLFRIV
jgi:hypothetical protein